MGRHGFGIARQTGARIEAGGFDRARDRERGADSVQNLRMSISRALSESAVVASVNALMLEVCGSSLRKKNRPLRSMARTATVLGLRLRVLSVNHREPSSYAQISILVQRRIRARQAPPDVPRL